MRAAPPANCKSMFNYDTDLLYKGTPRPTKLARDESSSCHEENSAGRVPRNTFHEVPESYLVSKSPDIDCHWYQETRFTSYQSPILLANPTTLTFLQSLWLSDIHDKVLANVITVIKLRIPIRAIVPKLDLLRLAPFFR